ncbi:glycosyltransferase family 2 protein [Gracilibacillus thailandensis]|uniref:Glycosyltransferase n=1 Tax=Gracilibacillus thailandensis TaxID=563735 RepID=A0A6N7R3Y5_9BACI|nr:glycosyltransferase family 2 protein [Gracilibacillus thailandensis]MRI67919.1 glycosyltransferase [Gracilibacillus thailandensis]
MTSEQTNINKQKKFNELQKQLKELELRLEEEEKKEKKLINKFNELNLKSETTDDLYRKELSRKKKEEKKLRRIENSRIWRLTFPIRYTIASLKGKKYKEEFNIKTNNKKSGKGSLEKIKQLEKALWGGFSKYALPEVEDIKNSLSEPTNIKIRAAWILAKWYYDLQDYDRALEEIKYVNEFDMRKNTFLSNTISEIKVLRSQGQLDLAKNKLWNISEDVGFNSEFILAMAHVEKSPESKLKWLNLIYEKHGYTLVEKRDKERNLALDNLISNSKKADSNLNQYKISIIVPAFKAEDSIHIALNSLLEQTVKNIEIIVVDDCSPDNTAGIVQEFVKRDSRVKLIRKERNEGAYAARNEGLLQATGDYITVHDSDDWSHPQKLEIQLTEILKKPNVIGSFSNLIRISNELLPINAGSLLSKRFLIMNTSSLLFDRKVISVIGGWDSVRVAGDTEFLWRLQKAFGEDSLALVEPNVPLSLALFSESSLTGTSQTHVKTIRFGLRRIYREAGEWWQNNVENEKDLFVDPKRYNKKFPRPIPIMNKKPEDLTYDFVFIGDFASEESIQSILRNMNDAGEKNKKMAIYHWPYYQNDIKSPIIDEVYKLCNKYDVALLIPNEEVNTGTTLVYTSHVLDYVLDGGPNIDSHESFIIENKEISEESKKLREKNLLNVCNISAKWKSKFDI